MLGAGYGQAAQQQAVEEREHRRVRPDADGDGEDRGHAEDRAAAERTKAVAEVAEQSLQPHEDVALPRALPLGKIAAEPALGFAPRLLGRGPGGHELLDALGEMEGHLSVDVVRDLVRAKDVAEAR